MQRSTRALVARHRGSIRRHGPGALDDRRLSLGKIDRKPEHRRANAIFRRGGVDAKGAGRGVDRQIIGLDVDTDAVHERSIGGPSIELSNGFFPPRRVPPTRISTAAAEPGTTARHARSGRFAVIAAHAADDVNDEVWGLFYALLGTSCRAAAP